MLGRFLEFSVATPDIRDSLDFYTKLGFTQAGRRPIEPPSAAGTGTGVVWRLVR